MEFASSLSLGQAAHVPANARRSSARKKRRGRKASRKGRRKRRNNKEGDVFHALLRGCANPEQNWSDRDAMDVKRRARQKERGSHEFLRVKAPLLSASGSLYWSWFSAFRPSGSYAAPTFPTAWRVAIPRRQQASPTGGGAASTGTGFRTKQTQFANSAQGPTLGAVTNTLFTKGYYT